MFVLVSVPIVSRFHFDTSINETLHDNDVSSRALQQKSNVKMKGYLKLAHLMGSFPEAAIFRQFSVLSVQNLLYLQAELQSLEFNLRKFAEADDNSLHPDRKVYSLDWFALKESSEDTAEEGNDEKQWETACLIREKLEIYRKQHRLIHRGRRIDI
jgi:hypothetical protein